MRTLVNKKLIEIQKINIIKTDKNSIDKKVSHTHFLFVIVYPIKNFVQKNHKLFFLNKHLKNFSYLFFVIKFMEYKTVNLTSELIDNY